MALEAKVQTFQAPAATGTQDYTGFGFQPKLILLFTDTGTALDNQQAHAFANLGAAVSSTSRFAYGATSRDNSGSWKKYSNKKTSACIAVRDLTPVDWAVADFDSFLADGFRLDWTTAPASQRYHGVLALGGDDLTNVAIMEFTAATSTGTQAITGVGFQPDAVMIVCTGMTTAGDAAQDDDTRYSIGVATGTSSNDYRAAGGAAADSAIGIDGPEYRAFAASLLRLIDHDGSLTALKTATLDSFDADGFTLDYTVADANAYRCFAVCIKGPSFAVGQEATPTSTGTKSTAGTGFPPKAVLVASTQQTAAGASSDRYLSLGVATATDGSEHFALWNGSENDPATNSVADRANESDVVLTIFSEGTPVKLEELEVDSFDADGVTWESLTADSNEHLFAFLAVGDTADVRDLGFQLAPAGVDPSDDHIIWEAAP